MSWQVLTMRGPFSLSVLRLFQDQRLYFVKSAIYSCQYRKIMAYTLRHSLKTLVTKETATPHTNKITIQVHCITSSNHNSTQNLAYKEKPHPNWKIYPIWDQRLHKHSTDIPVSSRGDECLCTIWDGASLRAGSYLHRRDRRVYPIVDRIRDGDTDMPLTLLTARRGRKVPVA